MRTYWKDLLKVGTFYPPDLDGEAVTFTPEDLRDLANTGNAMIAAGWAPPVCFEHNKKAIPFGRGVSPSERRARGYIGKPRRFACQSGGRLCVLVDVDDDDANHVEKIGFVSPYIGFDVRTGDGKVWKGPSIEHIAVTPIPVNPDQKPFRRVGNSQPAGVAVSLSRACSLGLALSMADYGGGKMADEATADKADENTETTTASDVDTGVAMGDGETKSGDDGELTALLEQDGLFCPADMMGDLEQFKIALTISLKTKMNMGGDAAAADEEELAEETPDGGANAEVPAGASVPAPGAAGGMGGDYGLSLADASAKLIEHGPGGRNDLLRRLDRCLKTGRITPFIFAKEKAALAKVKLALSRAGDVEASDASIRLAAYEALPGNKDRAKEGTALSRAGAAAEETPADMHAVPTNEKEAAPVLDGWAKATGTLR